MKCFHPIQGYQLPANAGEKRPVTFKDHGNGQPIEVRCGQCIGCRISKARTWAVRMVHEAQEHSENSFITLTYDDQHLPENASLSVRDWQLFLKKLRKHLAPKKIRFYMCGEYGEAPDQLNQIGRPHFHAIIFGHTFMADAELKREEPKAYYSETLEEVWGNGIAEFGPMELGSAAYCAQYTVKKITGKNAADHYLRMNPYTGEVTPIKPEFSTMSRRPGIGKTWYEKYNGDLDKGFVTLDGKKEAIPAFYKRIMEDEKAFELERIREDNLANLKKQDRWNLEAEEKTYLELTRNIQR
ncbi:replication initiator protein [Microviridae sp.]|nr:replication initiator protein [Microviridae sp.]